MCISLAFARLCLIVGTESGGNSGRGGGAEGGVVGVGVQFVRDV